MVLSLHIRSAATNEVVPVKISKMSKADAMQTNKEPLWQSSWTSAFISDKEKLKYALKTADGELVALGAYRVQPTCVAVEILYIESHPESNPTMTKQKKYIGIGKAMIAFGIALSCNHGCEGCVVFEAKTSELAEHYIRDFGAIPLSSFGGPQRFMLEGDTAYAIVSEYLKETVTFSAPESGGPRWTVMVSGMYGMIGAMRYLLRASAEECQIPVSGRSCPAVSAWG